MAVKRVLVGFLAAVAFVVAVVIGCSENPVEPGGSVIRSKQYVVQFNTAGGAPGAIPEVVVDSGAALGGRFPGDPVRVGYVFHGWFYDNMQYDGASAITRPVRLTARWADTTIHTLATDASPLEGGTVTRDPDLEGYEAGTQVVVIASPAEGYTFIGWSGANTSENPSLTVTMDSSITLSARFERTPPEMLALITNSLPTAGGNVSREPNATTYAEGAEVTVTAESADGWVFTGWSGASTSEDPVLTIIMDSAQTLTANFMRHDLILNIGEAWVSGGVYGSRTGYVFQPNGIFMHINDRDGWALDFESTWSEKDGVLTLRGGDSVEYMVSDGTLALRYGNDEVFVFTRIGGVSISGLFTLTVNVSGPENAGAVSVPGETAHSSGRRVQVTAEPASGYVFIGWSGASSSTEPAVTVTMDGNQTLTAHFRTAAEACALTVNRVPETGGAVSFDSGGECAEGCAVGTSVTAVAVPARGYKFAGWSGAAASSDGSVTIVMNSDRTLTANFVKEPTYAIVANASPAAGGYVLLNHDEADYLLGDVVEAIAVPRAGYRFAGWSGAEAAEDSDDDELELETANPLAVTIDGNVIITANFVKDAYSLAVATTAGGRVYAFIEVEVPDMAGEPGAMITRRDSVSIRPDYITGVDVNLAAVPLAGHEFVGWTGTLGDLPASDSVMTVTMDQNLTLTAHFRPIPVGITYRLTTSVVGSGTVSPGSSTTYSSGTTVAVTATPMAGHRFVSWVGASTSTSRTIVITMTNNHELIAIFEPNTQ
jgi:uncharacterized repeat protein (TIGR02543 family)